MLRLSKSSGLAASSGSGKTVSFTWEGFLEVTDRRRTGATLTVTHNLGVVPDRVVMIHQKTDGSWICQRVNYHMNKWWAGGDPWSIASYGFSGYQVYDVSETQASIRYYQLGGGASPTRVRVSCWA